MNSITAIVPFFNEEKYLMQSVNRLIEQKIFEKIILVDDNSNDNSLKIAKELAKLNNQISILENKLNLGKGACIKKAIDFVNTKYLIIHDADLEYNPIDILEMLEAAVLNKNSIILGSRVIGDKKRNNLYIRTFLAQKIYSRIFNYLNFQKLSDIASCYWLIETEKLKKFEIEENGFAIEVEVLSKAVKNSLNFIEVPIQYDGRSYEDGKKIKLKDGLIILYKIIKYSRFFTIFKNFKFSK